MNINYNYDRPKNTELDQFLAKYRVMAKLALEFCNAIADFKDCEGKIHPKWFQYNGYKIKKLEKATYLSLEFRSSQVSVCFRIEVQLNNTAEDIDYSDYLFSHDAAYEYFKELKYSIIGEKHRVNK